MKDVTFVGVPHDRAKRKLEIQKVENGFLVEAKYLERYKDHEDRDRARTTEKAFVFHTIEKTNEFTSKYFTCEAEHLEVTTE